MCSLLSPGNSLLLIREWQGNAADDDARRGSFIQREALPFALSEEPVHAPAAPIAMNATILAASSQPPGFEKPPRVIGIDQRKWLSRDVADETPMVSER